MDHGDVNEESAIRKRYINVWSDSVVVKDSRFNVDDSIQRPKDLGDDINDPIVSNRHGRSRHPLTGEEVAFVFCKDVAAGAFFREIILAR